MGDEDLPSVLALQRGDDTALNELIGRHQRELFGFIFRYVRNETDAVEITQETFIRAYFHIRSFKPRARFVTWLFAIALNLCRDHVRSRHYREAHRTVSLTSPEGNLVTDILSSDPAPDKIAERDEQMRAVEDAIDRLPHDLKTALILTALEGYSHLEAAAQLGTTTKTIETRVYRARRQLGKI